MTAQRGQKPRMEQTGRANLNSMFSTHRDCESMAYRFFWLEEFSAKCVKSVITEITGLWLPRFHSAVTFRYFDVGSFCHCEEEFAKRRIIHPPTGNVSRV